MTDTIDMLRAENARLKQQLQAMQDATRRQTLADERLAAELRTIRQDLMSR